VGKKDEEKRKQNVRIKGKNKIKMETKREKKMKTLRHGVDGSYHPS